MSIRFRPLLTLRVTHAYYEAGNRDFDFVIPGDTAVSLRGGKLLARDIEGTLNVVYEADDTDAPRVRLSGKVLRLGVGCRNPRISNITAFPYTFPAEVAAFTNFAAAGTLAQSATVTLVDRVLFHRIRATARPVVVTARDAQGAAVRNDANPGGAIAATTTRDVSFALDGHPLGLVEVEEVSSAGSTTHTYYFDRELAHRAPACVVEIAIDNSFYSTPPAFQIAFSARSEPLSYYVVARNHSNAEFNGLSVADTGEPGRPTIAFTRIAASAFAATDIQPALLASTGERVALFRSTAPVARREKGRKGIRLTRGGDVLIANLPQPGPDRASADMIVHVSKP